MCLENLQGHSVESSLPSLPENGPTAETAALELDVRGIDDSPVPSATSREEENVETTEATVEQPNPAATEGKCRRKKLRLAHSSSSSPAKDPDVAYLHLENSKVPVYSANLWIESFTHTV